MPRARSRARYLAVRNAHAEPNAEHMRSIQHAPVFEVLMIFRFEGRCRRLEIQDFGLLSDTIFGEIVEAALTAQHQQHTKNLKFLLYLQYYLFSQLSDDIVFILFGQMSELHQFGLLGTSLELFREHLQAFNRPDLSIKKTKKSSASFNDFFWLAGFSRIPSNDVTHMSVSRHG
jgi:hypothetical protein